MTGKPDNPPPGPKLADIHAAVLSWYDSSVLDDAMTAEKVAEAKFEKLKDIVERLATAYRARDFVKRIATGDRTRGRVNPRHSVRVVAKNILPQINAELPPEERPSIGLVEYIIKRLEKSQAL